MRFILSLSGTISTAISILGLLLSRIITTTTTLLLAMAGLALVALSPAQAVDTYYPCQAMVSTVSPGTTYYSQSISCAITGAVAKIRSGRVKAGSHRWLTHKDRTGG